jgi:hypothetical protein
LEIWLHSIEEEVARLSESRTQVPGCTVCEAYLNGAVASLKWLTGGPPPSQFSITNGHLTQCN